MKDCSISREAQPQSLKMSLLPKMPQSGPDVGMMREASSVSLKEKIKNDSHLAQVLRNDTQSSPILMASIHFPKKENAPPRVTSACLQFHPLFTFIYAGLCNDKRGIERSWKAENHLGLHKYYLWIGDKGFLAWRIIVFIYCE